MMRMLVALLLVTSCTKITEPNTPLQVRQQKNNNASVLKTMSDFMVNDHKENHGKIFYENSGVCKACHGQDLRGGDRAKTACNSCHAQFPHPPGFALHGKAFAQPNQDCYRCHGANYLGGGSKISCKECHDKQNFPWPHTVEFKKTDLHGQQYAQNKDQCAQCHGSGFLGSWTNISCQSCHQYPHADGWALPTNHGTAYLKDSGPSSLCLVRCHSKEQFQQRHDVTCQSCHVIIPHGEAFVKDMAHKELASSQTGKCTHCHTDLVRLMPNFKNGCKDCHSDKDTVPHFDWRESE
ncbi:MAG: hypothetical protein HYS98_04055 [Deltaproteobacteria bacterium]|nr:hypothetical protein [Deltaproteobacteria bacterium]